METLKEIEAADRALLARQGSQQVEKNEIWIVAGSTAAERQVRFYGQAVDDKAQGCFEAYEGQMPFLWRRADNAWRLVHRGF